LTNTQQIQVIARWEMEKDGYVGWTFVANIDTVIQNTELMKQQFNSQFPLFMFNGMYYGVEPKGYMLIFAIKKKSYKEHKEFLWQKLEERFKKKYENLPWDISDKIETILTGHVKINKKLEAIIAQNRKLDEYIKKEDQK